MYLATLKTMPDTDYSYYNFTITQSVKQFFSQYTNYFTWYNAHQLPCDVILTYQICQQRYTGQLTGIEYMQRYLQAIYYENIFLQCFSPGAIRQVLQDYHMDYNSILFNVFEETLKAAIGCTLAQSGAEITPDAAYRQLIDQTGLKSAHAQEYVKQCILQYRNP